MIRISIVIATYNRSGQLLRTLRSLLRQTLPLELFEVVVVDNNSSDDTEDICKHFTAKHPKLQMQYVFESKQGLSYARNSGIQQSKGECIAIIDDDEEVNDDFAKSYYDFFHNYRYARACGGKIVPIYEEKPPSWFSEYASRPIGGGLDLGKKIIPFHGERYPGGGNMAFRRTIFDRYGMFDPNLGRTGDTVLGGEEKDLFQRIREGGETIYYVPDAIIYHIIPAKRLSKEYFHRLTKMIGVSERVRTQNISKTAYRKRLLAEVIKWGGTLVFLVGYAFMLQPQKGWALVEMRWNISRGLLGLHKK